ncbi:hypothetical protein TELCIR_14353, partial [Teladorsagia circumcincta]
SFLRDRQAHDHEATAMMKAQFMSLWDGFATTNDKIIVMGATNRPQDVDPAILRRMSARFAIPMPSEKQREQILRDMTFTFIDNSAPTKRQRKY